MRQVPFILLFLFTCSAVVLGAEGIDLPKVKWRIKTDGPIRGGSVAGDQKIYFASSDGSVYAADRSSGDLTWQFQTDGAIVSAPALSGGSVFVSGRDNFVYSIDAANGTLKWKFAMEPILPDPSGGWEYFMASPVVQEQRLLVGSGDGHLYALEAGTGKLAWKFQTKGRIRAAPLVQDGTIYQPSNDGFVYVLNARDGRLLWQFETRGTISEQPGFGPDKSSIFTQPVIQNGLLLFGSRDGHVYAVDLATRKEKWSFTYGPTWAMAISAADGVVYVGWSTNNLVCAIDLNTGKEVWKYTCGAYNYTTPLVIDEGVYIGSADGYVYRLNKDTGEKVWSYPVGQEVYSSLSFDGSSLFFGSDNGYFYALESGQPVHKAVYHPTVIEGNAQYLVVDAKITPYLSEKGFERLDSAGLRQFLNERLEDRQPSVVVFSLPLIPKNIIGEAPEKGLMRRYLEAGGKVVWMGDIPNFYEPDASGNFKRDATAGTRLLGVDFTHPSEGGNYYSQATREGLNWGLPKWLKTTNSTVAPVGVVPLAWDEYGRVGMWVKEFTDRPGSGFVSSRTWAWAVPMTSHDLELIYKLAIYGLE